MMTVLSRNGNNIKARLVAMATIWNDVSLHFRPVSLCRSRVFNDAHDALRLELFRSRCCACYCVLFCRRGRRSETGDEQMVRSAHPTMTLPSSSQFVQCLSQFVVTFGSPATSTLDDSKPNNFATSLLVTGNG